MRKAILLFAVFTAIVTIGGYSEDIPQIDSKEEAIVIVTKNRDLMIIAHYEEDTLANIDRFIGKVNKIVPVDEQKHDRLKTQLLSVLRKRDGDWTHWTLVCWPVGYPAFVGPNAEQVLKDNFDAADYEKVSACLSNDLTLTKSAYDYLKRVYLQEKRESARSDEVIAFPYGFPQRTMEMIYEYFDL